MPHKWDGRGRILPYLLQRVLWNAFVSPGMGVSRISITPHTDSTLLGFRQCGSVRVTTRDIRTTKADAQTTSSLVQVLILGHDGTRPYKFRKRIIHQHDWVAYSAWVETCGDVMDASPSYGILMIMLKQLSTSAYLVLQPIYYWDECGSPSRAFKQRGNAQQCRRGYLIRG